MFFLALTACSPDSGVFPISAPVATPAFPAVLEMRVLTLDYPAAIRMGDEGEVRLMFEVDAGEALSGIRDVFETHNVLADARLGMAGVEGRPADTISEPLLPGQKVTFYWSIRPAEVGKYRGTVWFYLHFVPKTIGEESRMALSSQLMDIDATALFGLKAGPARWLGVLGTFLGSVLGFPFLESALKWVWGKVSLAKAG